MKGDYDVLVVGGGLAGGCLVLALAESGLRVALVDAVTDQQRHDSPAGDRALALANATVRILDDLGVWKRVASEAAAIRSIHVSDRGHFGKARLSADQENVDALGYVITARVLEDAVADALAAVEGLQRFCPARVVGLEAEAEVACVSVMSEGQSMNVDARLVVGADGGDSSVRRLQDIGQKIRDYGQTAIVTLVKPEKDPNGTAFERFTSSGPLALLPTHDGHCSVVWSLYTEDAEDAKSLSDGVFLERLQQCFGYRLGRLALAGPRRAFPLTLVRAEAMVAERTALIGNAVHQLHPVAGQGFNLGLRDVVHLAERLVEIAERGDDPGAADMLADYAEVRKNDHDRVIGFTDSLVRLFSNDWVPCAAARNLGLLALDRIGGAKHALARHAMGLSGRLPRLVQGRDAR